MRPVAKNRWMISVNSMGTLWKSWINVLKKNSMSKLIVPHLGIPGRWIKPPSEYEASAIMKSVTNLSVFSEVHVKLSSFYAFSEPAHDYPAPSAWSLTNELANSFGT